MRLLALVSASIVATSVVSCGGDSEESPSAKDSSAEAKTVRVGLAYDVDSQGSGANMAAEEGLERAAKELDIDQRELAAVSGETENDKYVRLTLLCEAGYSPVIVIGFAYVGSDPSNGPLAKAAKDCPTTHFTIIDESGVTADNIANLLFADAQGSFLVGAAAALKSTTGTVGFVGGCDTAMIKEYEAGYAAGARAVNPTITVMNGYVSTAAQTCSGFADATKAETVTYGLIDAGADVIYHAARSAGSGVFAAVAARGVLAIGTDSDQYSTVSNELKQVVLTSMVKRVDTAVYTIIKNEFNGTFTNGATILDLAADGVGYSTSGGALDGLTNTIDQFRQQIVDGTITVPTQPA